MDAPLDNLFPPISYPTIWLVIGIALAAGSVVWAIAAILLTRPARAGMPVATAGLRPRTLADIRARYEERIAEVERQHAAGSMSGRESHLQLSALIRQYAQETRGVDAPVMTLSELRAAGLGPVSGAVEMYYPAEFMPGEIGDVSQAAAAARQVVQGWN